MPEPRIFIVEDEFLHLENTKLCVEEAGFELAGECDNADEAQWAIRSAKPDVVLMDISLPGKNNGITVAKKIQGEKGPPVIFTTSFTDNETMQEAAAVSPVSYLVKPLQTANLKAAVTLALAKKTETTELDISEEAVFIKSGNKLHKLLLSDVLWVEAAGDNYCKLVTERQQLVSRHTVKQLYLKLPQDQFVQTHRAYVVNVSKIESIHEKEQVVVLPGGEIPIGRSFKEDLYRRLKRF